MADYLTFLFCLLVCFLAVTHQGTGIPSATMGVAYDDVENSPQ